MSTATKTRKATKTVQRIARISFKHDPRKVVYLVRSSDGAETYETSFFDGKAVGCTCPAQKPCYHMIQLQEIEAARAVLNASEVPANAYELGIGLEQDEELQELLAQVDEALAGFEATSDAEEDEDIDEEARFARYRNFELQLAGGVL